MGEFLTDFFVQIWRIFQMPCGLFGLTFGDILLGGFAVTIGIVIVQNVAITSGTAFQKSTGGAIRWQKRYKSKGEDK